MMALPPLPPTSISREQLASTFQGPTNKSNWVVPGRLLCGDRSSLDSAAGLQAIFDVGVTTIVCLQTRSETKAAVDYRPKALAMRSGTNFVELPIPDQQVTDDVLVEDLVDQLLQRLQSGEVLYVHCRGGHGRTGTICSILLGRLYDLPGPEAMARTQLYHDTRKQPIFCADGYQETEDGSSCVIMFPSQHQQVLRLVLAAVPQLLVGRRSLARAESSKFGAGASKYSTGDMEEWKATAMAATSALNSARRILSGSTTVASSSSSGSTDLGIGCSGGDCQAATEALHKATELFSTACKLRPEFVRGYIGLSQALRLLGQPCEAREAVSRGIEQDPHDAALQKELTLVEKTGGILGSVQCLKSSDCQLVGEEEACATSASQAPTHITWKPQILQPSVVMLVGLPGSGKSTFAEQLVVSRGGYVRVCQDELPGRDAFETDVGRTARDSSKRLIMDRTNVKRRDRKMFLDLAFNPKRAVCVFFDHSADECMQRVAHRTSHPTIRYGGGQHAVRSMRKDLEAPMLEEGFEEVIVLRSFSEADHLLQCWGATPPQTNPPGFFKFPTTPHVLDLTHGRALQESDRLLSPTEAEEFFNGTNVLIVEEKVDGANLGISLTENWEPRFQNRAHFVTSTYASQWKGLDAWWEEHSWSVCQLLVPEVEVLFGEWTWQRHSQEYTRLPAYFIAFDIYNKRERRFVSARERDRRLQEAGGVIPSVPHLTERVFHSRADLEQLTTLHSAYGNGPLEGIYLRMDEPEGEGGGLWLRQRGKIVRADFIQGIEEGGHFLNKEVVRNKLAF